MGGEEGRVGEGDVIGVGCGGDGTRICEIIFCVELAGRGGE